MLKVEKVGNFQYVREGREELQADHPVVRWAVDEFGRDIAGTDVHAIVTGVVTGTEAKEGHRLFFKTNTGGSEWMVLNLVSMLVIRNFREIVRKSGWISFRHLPWKQRVLIWLLIRLPW